MSSFIFACNALNRNRIVRSTTITKPIRTIGFVIVHSKRTTIDLDQVSGLEIDCKIPLYMSDALNPATRYPQQNNFSITLQPENE